MLILIVEDDRSICEVLEMYLSNHKTLVAHCVPSALEHLDLGPNAVLLDWFLEKEDSSRVIEKIKSMNPTPKIVLMSASNQLETVAEKYALRSVLKKPFSLEELDSHLLH